MENFELQKIRVQTEKTFRNKTLECKLLFIEDDEQPPILSRVEICDSYSNEVILDTVGGLAKVVCETLNEIFKNQKDN